MLSSLIGAALVLFTLRDVVFELFQPSGSGSLSRAVSRGLWVAFRAAARRRPRVLPLAGPTILASVLFVWALLLIIGWALAYWPNMPGSFRFATSLQSTVGNQFVSAVYLSIVTLATLGFGDITPETPMLRIIAAVQGLVGFAFLTAGISWILSITPVLTRRRSFAHFLCMLSASLFGSGAADRTALTVPLFLTLSERLATLRTDLVNTPVTYYFHNSLDADSVAAQLPSLYALAQSLDQPGAPADVRDSSKLLCTAIDSFAIVLANRFLRTGEASTASVLKEYAVDHGRAIHRRER